MQIVKGPYTLGGGPVPKSRGEVPTDLLRAVSTKVSSSDEIAFARFREGRGGIDSSKSVSCPPPVPRDRLLEPLALALSTALPELALVFVTRLDGGIAGLASSLSGSVAVLDTTVDLTPFLDLDKVTCPSSLSSAAPLRLDFAFTFATSREGWSTFVSFS